MNPIDRLKHTINASVSPYHCIIESARQLEEAGFTSLKLEEAWSVKKGGCYYIKIYDSSLLAFTVGNDLGTSPKFRIASSHTDWPCLKVKPSPEVTAARYGKLNVEVYGGPILNTWMDRPLSMAGKVSVKTEKPMEPSTIFVDFKRPLLTIPNLAIHMNREVNNGVALNSQIDMLPLLTILDGELNKDNYFLDMLAEETGVPKDNILDYEIYIYNSEDGVLLGKENEFFSSPRLDNITSVQACLTGLMESKNKDSIHVIGLYDNEEVGSSTKQGAASALTERVLEKLLLSLGYGREAFFDALFGGFLLSIDVAHAIHPNHGEKCDIKNQIVTGDGVAMKLAASQSYATDAACAGIVEGICRANQIPYKKFSNRSDIRGGSTLGSISTAMLSMRGADIGVPLLAMHSSRELMAKKDQEALVSLVKAYFNA